MAKIDYLEGDAALLEAVEPLWNKLNQIHASLSPHFAEWFAQRTFAQRRASLCTKTRSALRVDLARDTETGQTIGYSVVSIEGDGAGEIDSLYVEPDYRGAGIGDRLMQRGLAWLDGQGVTAKQLGVAAGNEQVLAFYARYGFFPRRIVLQQKPLEAP
jgi:ribosomal protein S18 acetylase RimI-like enzyme